MPLRLVGSPIRFIAGIDHSFDAPRFHVGSPIRFLTSVDHSLDARHPVSAWESDPLHRRHRSRLTRGTRLHVGESSPLHRRHRSFGRREAPRLHVGSPIRFTSIGHTLDARTPLRLNIGSKVRSGPRIRPLVANQRAAQRPVDRDAPRTNAHIDELLRSAFAARRLNNAPGSATSHTARYSHAPQARPPPAEGPFGQGRRGAEAESVSRCSSSRAAFHRQR